MATFFTFLNEYYPTIFLIVKKKFRKNVLSLIANIVIFLVHKEQSLTLETH